MITQETRYESYEIVDKQTRYNEILEVLKTNVQGLSARLISYKLGYRERNAVAPRLNELVKKNIVEVCGKVKDRITNRSVAVYKLKEGE